MPPGRPLTTINSKNVVYIHRYFKRLLHHPQEMTAFLIHSDSYSSALHAFNAFEEHFNYMALEKGDVEQTYSVYQTLARWLDQYITEAGFMRCLNAFNQANYRTARKNNNKLVHMDISEEAHQTLMNLAQSLGLTKKETLDKILQRIRVIGL